MIVSADGKTFLVDSTFYGWSLSGIPPWERHSRLWEAVSGRKIRDLPKHSVSLALAPGGRILATSRCERKGQDREPHNPLVLIDTVTGEEIGRLTGHPKEVTCCAFSHDKRFLVTGSEDQTILVWDLTRFGTKKPSKGRDVISKSLAKLWAALTDADPAHAYPAMDKLAAAPGQSIPFLRSHLKLVKPVPTEHIERCVKDLDSDVFAVREKASATLLKLGDLAAPALLRALDKNISLEMYRRVERLLVKLEAAARMPEQLRISRAITVLEWANTVAARRLLAEWSRGAVGARLTEEAKSALRRLSSRPVAKP